MAGPHASPGSIMVTEVTFGESGLGPPARSVLSPLSSPVSDRKSMKTLDYLAAPLAALKAGDANKAIRMLEEIGVVHPELVETSYHLARAYEKVGDLARARELYAEVVSDGGHPFFSHAQNRLNELGGPPTSAATSVDEAPDDTAPTGEYAAVEQVAESVPPTELASEPGATTEDAAALAESASPGDESAASTEGAGDAPAEGAKAGKKKKK